VDGGTAAVTTISVSGGTITIGSAAGQTGGAGLAIGY
jgi:hypothetical protein